MQDKKIAFLGTPDFTVDFLELFKGIGLNVELIVTGEDKPHGRGMQIKSLGPKIWGDTNNIKVLQPKKLDQEFIEKLRESEAEKPWDLFIVIAYGKIIPEEVINMPEHGTINLHYSLLPKYRGASPVESAILNGDKETGITVQQMVYKLDAGDILFQEKVSINDEDTTSILRDKLNKRAIEIFPEFLENFFGGKFTPTKQDESQASSCGKFKKEDLDVTLDIKNNDLKNIWKKYRAYDKKVFFFQTVNDKKVRVKITEMSADEILKVLPESKKEITKLEFEKSFGEIFTKK